MWMSNLPFLLSASCVCFENCRDFELGDGSGLRGEECQTAHAHRKHLCDAVALALNFVGDEV